MSVAIEALNGTLTRPLKWGELVELMAQDGLQEPSAGRRREAEGVLRGLASAGLRPRRHEELREVPNEWEQFRAWDELRDSPSERERIDPVTGRAGRWVRVQALSGPSERPAGARPVFRTEAEERFHPEDAAKFLKGPLGAHLDRQGWVTAPLKTWCEAAGERVEKPMQRNELLAAWNFVKANGKVLSGADTLKALKEKGLTPVKRGLYDPFEVRRFAEAEGLTMKPRPIRGGADADGALNLNWGGATEGE